ncbi:cAMP regulatory protein [Variovorax sp. SRS16]|nr:cAMP regulatory protein [Variovorax sp. SRS16]
MLRGGVAVGSVFLLLNGRARLAGITQDGEEVLLRWFLPCEFVGLASLLGQLPFSVEATAFGDVEAVQIDALALRHHLETDPQGALFFAGIVSAFASEFVELFIHFATGRLETRILLVLRRLAAHESPTLESDGVRLQVSQQEIAHAVGASRQRVSVELGKLEAEGFIRLGYRHLVVLKANPGIDGSSA